MSYHDAPSDLSSLNKPRWNLRGVDLPWILLLAGGIFTVYRNLILVHFYVDGGYILDSGFLADLIWRNGLNPHTAAVAVSPDCTNYLQVHSFFLAPLLSALSYLRPMPMAVWFAVVYGFFHALTAVFVYLIFKLLLGRGIRARLGAFFGAGLLMLSPIVTENVRYPHLECFWFPGAAMVVLGLMMRRPWITALGLISAAATREDCGLHLAAPFLVFLALTALFPRFFSRVDFPTRRHYGLVSAAAVLLSVVAMLIPHLFVSKPPQFTDIYLGHPTYAHVTPAFLFHQTVFFLAVKPFLWAPLAVFLVMGLVYRDAIFIAAGFAYVPWLLLNLLAHQDGARHLETYHVFPLFLAFPFACLSPGNKARQNREEIGSGPLSDSFRCYTVIAAILVSITLQPFSVTRELARNIFRAPSADGIARTEAFYATLPRLRSELGTVMATAPVIALAPRSFFPGEVTHDHPPSPLHLPDSILFFDQGWDRKSLWPVLTPEYRTVQITGTPILIATKLPTANTPQLVSLSRAIPAIDGLMISEGAAFHDAAGITLGPGGSEVPRLFGPFIHLPAGQYRLIFALECGPGTDDRGCEVDVYAGGKILVESSCFQGPNGESKAAPVLAFEVAPGDADLPFEFRVNQLGTRPIRLTDLTLKRIAGMDAPAH